MKIAIIGAGLYGCHMATTLKNRSNEIDLYDQSDEIFSGASTYNSCRIHKGYHYPRSSKTRFMCMMDEIEFIDKYAHLTSPAADNPKIFCVANDDRTLLDYGTMKIIMDSSNLPFRELSPSLLKKYGFQNIEGGFEVYESIFLVDKAKKWFHHEIAEKGVRLKLNSHIDKVAPISSSQIKIHEDIYDLVINCTYNQAIPYFCNRYSYYYDLCFYLVVASKQNKIDNKCASFGVFDGGYPSLEPFGYEVIPPEYAAYKDKKIFQVFHVKHTSIRQYKDIKKARQEIRDGIPDELIKSTTDLILSDVEKFYPNFNTEFQVIGNNTALKTKVTDLSDSRPILVVRDEKIHKNFIQVFSAKLTTIIRAEKLIKQLIPAITSTNKLADQNNSAISIPNHDYATNIKVCS